jgi:alanine dehydrogenase
LVLFLSKNDVESVLTMREAIESVERAFQEYGSGTVSMPLRPTIKVPKQNGTVLFMPAYLEEMNALGVKVVSVYLDNPTKQGLPVILGVVLLSDPKSGELLAVMDGAFLTAVRTGAASGVATKYCARKDAAEVGIIGTGVQGKRQVEAVCEVRPIKKVKAYDLLQDRCKLFCSEAAKALGVQVVQVGSAKEAVSGSDIVLTASTSKTPVVEGGWLLAGAHVNAIGSHTPDARELDVATVKRAKLIVDSKEAALKEAGDLIIPISQGLLSQDHIYAELGEIVTGKKPGRENESEITVFKSQGLAIQDISTARKVYDLATKKGVGKTLQL